MKRTILLSAFVAVILVASGFTVQSPIEETRNLNDFSKVSFGIAGTLYINIGPEFKVVLEGDEDDLEDIITEVSGDRLIIKMESNWGMNLNEKVMVYITMPELKSLGVSGSGKAEIRDAVKTTDLSFSVSGSGKIYPGNIEAENLNCSISGSGDIILDHSGKVENAEIGISGSGNYSGESLEIDNADISISGSGSCTCNVKEELHARVSGSGDVYYTGDPKIDARVSGSGKIRSK